MKEVKRPAYLHIADGLEERIQTGEFSVGEKLPSERVLSEETGMARGTVKRAYRELEVRGRIHIVGGSGAYVAQRQESRDVAREEVRRTVALLREMGLGHTELEKLVQDCVWARLQDKERPRLAWVDCCPELLGTTMREIEVECGFSVKPMLLHQVMSAPNLLAQEYFHTVATSIEHYDQLHTAAQEVLHRTGTAVERIVLSLTAATIAGLASMEPDSRIAVVYQSPIFLDMVQRYLVEFGVKTSPAAVGIEEAIDQLTAGENRFHWVVLPPDEGYHDGACGRIAKVAEEQGCRVLFLRHGVDFGSLRQLQVLAQACR